MKVVHFTENVRDGAGRAVLNLHQGLLQEGVNSTIITKDDEDLSRKILKIHTKQSLILRILWKIYRVIFSPKTFYNFDCSLPNWKLIKQHLKNVDIICLHSIQTLLNSKDINKLYKSTGAPITWTTMDIEPITAGCHFNLGCEKYLIGCQKCPHIRYIPFFDITQRIWKNKKKYLSNLNITFIHPTSNMHSIGKRSKLFKAKDHKKIFLSIDQKVFYPRDKIKCRDKFGFSKESTILLFGCFDLSDYRKGGHKLIEALEHISSTLESKINLVTFGTQNSFNPNIENVEWTHLGRINNNEELSMLYGACDILCVPSIDDVGPMIINEAISCHRPIAAFNNGVASDLIIKGKTGSIASCYDSEELGDKILNLIKTFRNLDTKDFKNVAEKLSRKYQISSYIKTFEELTKK